MSEPFREYDTDRLLQQGLNDLPVPLASADFDARIHAALRDSPSKWQLLWATFRPICAAGACSLIVTLALLQGMSGASVAALSVSSPSSADHLAEQGSGERRNLLSRDVEEMDLSNASLIGLLPVRRTVPVRKPSAPHARPDGDHSSYHRIRSAAYPAA